MNIEPKHIITAILVVFKVYIILNFIIKYRKLKKKVIALEDENAVLRNCNIKPLSKSA
jgi:hypothetical protein